METSAFDQTASLPGPPEPWASTDTPSRRDGPPFHMTEMIAAEPYIAERIFRRLAPADSAAVRLAGAIAHAVRAGSPVVLTGCGTSENAAMAAAEILREALGPGEAAAVWSAQAFELSLGPPTSGLVIAISHEGATWATNQALTTARAAGARTAIVTVTDRSPGAALADIVITTEELDQAWCHTVGYVSPIAAAAAVAAHLTGTVPAGTVVRELLASGLSAAETGAAESIAGALAGVERLLVLASGADRAAGRELVLKVEEGAWLPAAFRGLETFLHGHLAATGETTGIVAIATDRRSRDDRTARLRGALAAARVIGMPTAAIVSSGVDALLPAELTSAGRIVIDEADSEVPAAVASLLASATALQTLTERLARARGKDPDPIHRDVDRYREAAEAAETTA
jgi:glucosamine--fructose-6-phosphate aminotransferase (isomerizing)